jgi:glycosyltransferase involved in cell wall biosynthesis
MLKKSNTNNSRPYFSICIPQYNRTDFLIKALSTFKKQEFKDFEVCIYDDNSNDNGMDKVLTYLENSNMNYSYYRSKNNGRYDVSLRGAIDLSKGKYTLLMGNDDGLMNSNTLRLIHNKIENYDNISVVVTNYIVLTDGEKVKRIPETKTYGSGPLTAASFFRNYAFVSGVILNGDKARDLATDRLDGSEMYQMYLATSIVSMGGEILGIRDICIQKDLQIQGQEIDSYKTHAKVTKCSLTARKLPMSRIFEVILVGLESMPDGRQKEECLLKIAKQLYMFTYPYWIIEYRREQSWCYSFGIYRALNPLIVINKVYQFSFYNKVKLTLLYIASGMAGFLIPILIFNKFRPFLYKIAKKQ